MKKPLPQIDAVQIEKLVYGGQALGHALTKPIFVWNALPGERVRVQVTRKNSKIIEGVAIEILESSPIRITPQEAHWMSCSPWQILSVENERANKIAYAQEAYGHAGMPIESLPYIESFSEYGYRNKIEWSFAANALGEPSLAFFDRGTHVRRSVDSCVLASSTITRVSQSILEWIRAKQIPLRSLKSMIVRSNAAGQAIVALFLKDRLTFASYPALSSEIIGVHIYYSSHKSPASVVHGVLYSFGEESLVQRVRATELYHGLNGFFQVNIPVFECVIQDIGERIPHDRMILDMYGGVGAIGIPLAKMHNQELKIVENNPESVQYAQKNIQHNAVRGQAVLAETEKALDAIVSEATLIVDPPRSGLHEKVIARIGEAQPEVIAYVSCNISTQARDVQMLSRWYDVEYTALYNFFPHTPHIEGLCILRKKSI